MEQSCPHLTESNLTKNLQGKLIYKDECTRCFDSAKSEQGVDVCLKCFNGGCTTQEFNHSLLHFNHQKHPITMNIRKILKESESREKPAQITKLAIGKPGGIDPEQDNYDTVVSLKCLACNKQLDHTNQMVSGLVDSVLLSQSAYFQSTVQEWELKLEPCTHTKNLDQTGAQKIASKSLAHCNECDLSANLWLCMTCGHLGCGRKNWDGSGGNNHAVDHFDNHHHPLVCKLGTITPEGTASIYCYACNDDKNDEKLSEHLSALGIDVKTQTKTEKTTQELDLELNLNFTLSKIIEEGKQLIPLFGPGFTGLENLGNSCYMNSVLQILFSFPEFRDKYLNEAGLHLMTCPKFSPECLQCQISKLVDGIFSGRYSEKKIAKKIEYEGQSEEEKSKVDYIQDGIKPHMFKTLVGKGHPEFQTSQQQDANEYLHYFLEKIQRLEKSNGNPSPSEIFEFELETKTQCNECKGVKYSKTKAAQLTLIAPVDSNVEKGTKVEIEACLQRFFGDEYIPDFWCSNCNKKTVCIKTQRLNTFPKVLLVVLQRFVYDNWVPKKLDIELSVPLGLNDFERFRGNNGQLQPGEFQLPEAQAPQQDVEPQLNQDLLNQIIMMGVPENAAKRALHNTGNNSADMAATWYFEHMEDPDINDPLLVKQGGGSGDNIPQELVDSLLGLGFTEKKVRKALKSTDNNPDRAAEWLFSHMDDPDSDHEMTDVAQQESAYKDERPGVYSLHGFITHLGSSVHCGHYVCNLRNDGKWIYFNDAKVAETTEPPIGKGYMYFFVKSEKDQ